MLSCRPAETPQAAGVVRATGTVAGTEVALGYLVSFGTQRCCRLVHEATVAEHLVVAEAPAVWFKTGIHQLVHPCSFMMDQGRHELGAAAGGSGMKPFNICPESTMTSIADSSRPACLSLLEGLHRDSMSSEQLQRIYCLPCFSFDHRHLTRQL